MEKKMPYFRLYAQDFLVSVAVMTDQEVGAYMKLLCHQWVNHGIPADQSRIEHLVSSSGDDFKEVWMTLKSKFKKGDNGKLYNPRLEEIRAELKSYKQQKSDAGSAGAAARWEGHVKKGDKDSETNGNAIAEDTAGESQKDDEKPDKTEGKAPDKNMGSQKSKVKQQKLKDKDQKSKVNP